MALLIFQSTAARTRMITTNLRHRNDQWLIISIVGFRPAVGYGVNSGLVTAGIDKRWQVLSCSNLRRMVLAYRLILRITREDGATALLSDEFADGFTTERMSGCSYHFDPLAYKRFCGLILVYEPVQRFIVRSCRRLAYSSGDKNARMLFCGTFVAVVKSLKLV